MASSSSRLLWATMLAVSLNPAAWAVDVPSEHSYFAQFPDVLSASRLRQPQSEAPNAMTIIDRKMIVESGFRNIADLFKLVPGMYVSYYKGSQPIVSYHGATDQYSRRMQVMIDGRSVYMPPLNMVDWANLPITINDIERIEVIRGPAAASHGANSVQGVISIITRDAGYLDGKSVSYTHGNKGINDVSARFGAIGETFDYRMTLAYGADNGYDSLSAPPPGKVIGQPQVHTLLNNSHDSNQVRLLNYRGNYHPNDIDQFDIQFGVNHDVQGVGFNDKNIATNPNVFHDLISNSGFIQLGWTRSLNHFDELGIRYYHIQSDQHETLPYYQGGFFFAGPITQSVNTARDEIEIQHTLSFSRDNRLVYGAAYRTDHIRANGNIPLLPPAYAFSVRTDEYRVFAHDEWRIMPKLLLNIGGMLEKDGVGHENLSPRVALNFQVLPEHALRIGISVAHRTPSLVETQYPVDRYLQIRALYPATAIPLHSAGALFVGSQKVSSPGLIPEKLTSHEIGYLGKFGDGTTSTDVRLFRDQLGNGIFLAPTPTASSVFTNGLSAVYYGLEATLKHGLTERSDVTVNFAHELGRSNGHLLSASNPANAYLLSSDPNNKDILSASLPRNSASLLYSQKLGKGFNLAASYYYMDALQPFDRGSSDYQPAQRRVDVRLAKSFDLDKDVKGELSVIVQNLFDQGYTEYIANNLFNRRGYFTLTLDW